MNATTVLRARILRVALIPEGDGLRYRGRRSAIAELLPALEEQKFNIIAILHERADMITASDAVLAAQRLLRKR